MPPTIALFAPMMAKSACVWNPLIYAFKNQDFRVAITALVTEAVTTTRHKHKPTSNIVRMPKASNNLGGKSTDMKCSSV